MPSTTFSKLLIACLYLIFFVFQHVNAQTPRKLISTLSIAGTSKEVNINGNNYFYQQSVGQESVVGINSSKLYFLRQGFIQPLKGTISKFKNPNELQVTISPNPFDNRITLTFNDVISNDIVIMIYNSFGQVVRNFLFEPNQEINLNLDYLNRGIYVTKISSNGKQSSQKLIKY